MDFSEGGGRAEAVTLGDARDSALGEGEPRPHQSPSMPIGTSLEGQTWAGVMLPLHPVSVSLLGLFSQKFPQKPELPRQQATQMLPLPTPHNWPFLRESPASLAAIRSRC